MRSTAFGSKHFRPGGRSRHPASAESSVLFCRFCAVAAVAKGLPVFFVPKQPRVPLVGRDVVHLGRQGTASPAPALHAPRMIRQICLAHPPPRSAIPTAGGAGPPVRRLRRVPLAVASGGYQGGAPRVPARVLGFGWHGLGLLSKRKSADSYRGILDSCPRSDLPAQRLGRGTIFDFYILYHDKDTFDKCQKMCYLVIW